jgi:hypothetical protein
MNNEIEPLTWYKITKDIIIPLLSILTTVTIGIIIAIILKRREEIKDKKKLLTESYMEYLTSYSESLVKGCHSIFYEIFKEILFNYENYLESKSNKHVIVDKIKIRMDKYLIEHTQMKLGPTNLILLILRMTLLLEKDKYVKEMFNLIGSNYAKYNSPEDRKGLVNSILDQIKNDSEIKKKMNSDELLDIEFGLDLIERLANDVHDKKHWETFSPITVKLSERIYKYLGFGISKL